MPTEKERAAHKKRLAAKIAVKKAAAAKKKLAAKKVAQKKRSAARKAGDDRAVNALAGEGSLLDDLRKRRMKTQGL